MTIPPPKQGSHKQSLERYEIARQLKREGKTNAEIGALLGCTAQNVSYMINNTYRRRKQHAERKRGRNSRQYRCSVCGERGHNAQRHKNFTSEDQQWLAQKK